MLEGWGNLASLSVRTTSHSELLELLAVLERDVELVGDLAGVSVVDELLRTGERLINLRDSLLADSGRRECNGLLLPFAQKS